MAYAVVVSLKQTLEPLLDSGRSRIQIPNSELKLIYDDLCYLKFFFDKINSLEESNSVEEVDKQIKDVVQNTQDLVESHLSDLVHSGSESSISGFSRELVEVKGKLGSLIKVLRAKEDCLTVTGDQQSPSPLAADVAVSSEIDLERNNIIVGLDDELVRLLDWLVWDARELHVIPIVGMAGLGKTTLAKEVYLHQLIIQHFDVRLFAEIGVEYELNNLLLRLLGQVVSKEEGPTTVDVLGDTLYKYLVGRRFLIVLDDIWDIRAWDEIRSFLPNNKNGSKIIWTSRVSNLAARFKEIILQEIILQRYLNDGESWDLLRQIAFSNKEECPLELEEIGKVIAKNLGGLPLAIVEIGKLLSISPKTVGHWTTVALNINSRIQETNIPKIVDPSYSQLPQHLKACFLYLGLFPPNYNIPTAQLIKLWVAEGFIEPEPVAEKSLEQKAEEYLVDLVSRSLVIVHELNSSGRIKTCRIHQLFQDICVSAAQQEKLFHIVNEGTTEGTRNQRRLGIQSDVFGVLGPSVSSVRSLVFICPQHQHPLQPHVYRRYRWLRVLHAVSTRFWEFPHEVVELVRLRYLAITYHGELPSSISRLWNLEVLIIHPTDLTTNSSVFLPLEIWKLHKLRHLQCMGYDLLDPSAAARSSSECGLKKLQTLSGVSARTCTEGILARMPNLIKLGIRLESAGHAVEIPRHTFTERVEISSCFDAVLANLHHLESFKCAVMNRALRSEAAFSLIGFPSRLRKLSLGGCGFRWDEHMTIISQLPILQVLKLKWRSFCGPPVWELCDACFLWLEFLVLEDLDIEQLIADSWHLPVLKQLLVRRCYQLQEIPYGIGDIPTLKVIELDDCSNSVIASARQIMEEQQEFGNDNIQVRIHSSSNGSSQKD